MSCSVAVCNSPVFSPPQSLFCNKTSMISSATENLNLSHLKQQPSQQSSSSPSSAPPSPSPSSPFRLRIPKSSLSTLSGSVNSVPGPSSPVTQLKRKRPAKLCIPILAVGFGAAIPATPCTAAWRELVEEEREGYYSVYCKKGRREALEDRYSASLNLQGDPKQAFFGVFDGHGGAKAAEFAAKNLGKNILDEVVRRDDEDKIEESVKHGYLNTDSDFLKEDFSGGSCCVTALIRNGNLFVSNAGDCRAVLSSGGVAEALTNDHRPSRDDERARIENLGGYVDMCHGSWRIQGCLAVSRGIGDGHLKTFVTAEPEGQVLRLKPEHEFIILASDGLWDKVSNQEAVDIVRPSCLGIDRQQPLLACKKLAELSVSRGSRDDISVLVVPLERFI